MSTTIDERVVSMQFDNRHFEKNVSDTMSTLDKLKQKLNLDGAAKGFESLNVAANKVNLNGLSAAADNVALKFSHMQMTIQHQIDRIVDSAVNAGTRLAKSLSVDQITAGMSKYEQKTASIQTLVNSTGKSVEEINGYLEKLMWFSDETSYSLTDMVTGLATMVSSGGDIEQLIPMITGVANATAYAGKGAAEFSRVLQYGVNQAYALGHMQVMDWKTIEGATVNSKQLIQTLIEAGEELGTLKKAGYKAGEVTASNFRASLAKKWVTKEVMEKGFGKFSILSDAAYELLNGDITKFPEEVQKAFNAGEIQTAADAIKILSTHYDDLSVRAFKSAQEAKSFTEAIEATKDAVSSGWMTTFELIFGSYDEAKELWTNLANALWTVFAAGAEVRNWIIGTALKFSEPWDAIKEKIANVNKAVEKVKDATETLKEFQQIVSKVWRGDYGNGAKRFDLLKKAGYDARVVQDLVNKGSRYKLTVEDIEKSHKKFGLTLETTTEETEELTVALNDLSEEKLRELGLTEEEIDLYKALEKEAKKTGKTVEELSKEMSETDGRTLLFEGIDNIGKTIMGIAQAIKEAYIEIFNPVGAGELIVNIYKAIKAFKEFTESLLVVNEETGELNENGEKISRIFKGIFAAVDVVITILKGFGKIIFKTLSKVFEAFDIDILDVLAKIGDGFVSFRDAVNSSIESVSTFIADHIVVWIEKLKESEFIKTVAQWFTDAKQNIVDAVTKINEKIDQFESSEFVKNTRKLGGALQESEVFTTIIDGICNAFGKLKAFFSKFKLPEFSLENLTNFFKTAGKLFTKADGESFTSVGTFLKNFKDNILTFNWETFKNNALKKFTEFYLKWSDKIQTAFEKCKEVVQSIIKFIFGTNEVSMADILGIVDKVLALIVLIKVLNLLDGAIQPFDNITAALKNISSSLKWEAISGALKSLAIVLGVFTLCIIALVAIDDMDKVKQAAKMLTIAILALAGIVTVMGLLSSKIGKGWEALGAGITILAIIGALFLLVKMIKEIDTLQINDPKKTFNVLFGALAALAIGIMAVGEAGSSSFKSVAAILTMLTALKMMLDIIVAYDEFDWTGRAIAIQKMVEMLVILAVAVNIASMGVKENSSASGLALLLLSMVLSLKLLLGVIKDFAAVPEKDILKGGAVVLALLYVLTMLIAICNITAQGATPLEKGQKQANNFAGLAIALLAIVAAIWVLGKLVLNHNDVMMTGCKAVAQILLLMTAVFGIVGRSCSGLQIAPLIAMLVGFAGLMYLTKIIISELQGVPWEQQIASAGSLSLMMITMAGVLKTLTKHNPQPETIMKWVAALTALTVLMGVLAFILYNMRSINPGTAIGSAVALSGLMFAMTGVLHIISGFDMRKLTKQKLTKIAGAMAGLVVILWGLSVVLNGMKGLDPVTAVGNAIALGILLNVLAGVMAVCVVLSKTAGANIKGIVVCVAALAALGLVAWEVGAIIRKLNGAGLDGSAIGTVGVVSAMLVVLTGVMAVCAAMGTVLQNPMAMAGLAAAVAAIALLGLIALEIGAVIDMLHDAGLDGNAIGTVGVVSAMLVVLTGVMAACAGLGVVLQNPMVMLGLAVAVAAIALLGLVVWEIGAIIRKLHKNGLDESAIGTVNVLSAMLITMTGVLAALTVLGLGTAFAIGGVAALALLGLVVWEIGAIIRKLHDNGLDTSSVGTISMLSAMLLVMTGVITQLAELGIRIIPAAIGVSLISDMAVKMAALIVVLSAIKDTTTARTNCETMSGLFASLAVMIALLAPLGGKSILAAIALGIVVSLVAGMASLAIALGGLMTLIDSKFGAGAAETSIQRVFGIFKMVAAGIGEMFASFMSSATSSLPTVADNLSKFTDKLGPFISKVRGIGDDVATGAKNLMKAILAIVAADVITDIIAFFSGGSMSLTSLGEELSGFADGVKPFMDAMADMNADAAVGVAALCDAISALTSANLKDALVNLLPGDQTLSSFGDNIAAFADCIKDASISLSGLTDTDVENVKRAATAGEYLADLNKVIPSTGGLWQSIAGEKDLADWGGKISEFADCLVAYSNKVSGETIDKDAIQKSADAASAIADLNNNIPRSGGYWQEWVAGDKNLADWGKTIVDFAGYLVQYSDKVTGKSLDKEAIIKSADAASALADVNNALPKSDGAWQWIAGSKDMSSFGSGLSSLATGLVDYSTAAEQITDTKIAAITKSGEAVDAIKEVTEKLPDNGGKWGKLWSDKDPESFGEGVSTLCVGIKDAIDTASGVESSDIEAIDFLGQAAEKIKTNIENVPFFDISKAEHLQNGVTYMKGAYDVVHEITTAGYDFSGLTSLGNELGNVFSVFSIIDVDAFYTDAWTLKSGVGWINETGSLLDGLGDYSYAGADLLKAAVDTLADVDIDGVTKAFSGKAEGMTAAVEGIVNALIQGLSGGTKEVTTEAENLANAASNAIVNKTSVFEAAGVTLANFLINGVESKATGPVNTMETAGKNLGDGLVLGIGSKENQVYWAGYRLGQKAVEGEKKGQQSNSPSKATMKAGVWIGEGLIIGIKSMGSSVYNAGKEVGSEAVGSISKSIRAISNAIDTDMDFQPTIRPVVDLSDVKTGTNAINGMFDGIHGIGVRTNVSAISSMMNSRSQNGTNSDVVSAIDKLRGDLSNVGGTSYQINGVTYDDGSNIAEAVRTITRAAIRERRV